MGTQLQLPACQFDSERSVSDVRMRLAAELRVWWGSENAGFEAQLAGEDDLGGDLWANLPTVDSKTVARMAPLFEKHLGSPLDIKRIRLGGYEEIEDVIQDLVYEAPSSK